MPLLVDGIVKAGRRMSVRATQLPVQNVDGGDGYSAVGVNYLLNTTLFTASSTLALTVTSTLADQPVAGAMNGTAPMLFTVAGSLLGDGVLASNVTWTFTPTATATLFGQLATTSALVLTPAGALTGTGALVGVVPAVFAVDAAFEGTAVGEEGMAVGDGLVVGDMALGLHLNIWDRLQSNRAIS